MPGGEYKPLRVSRPIVALLVPKVQPTIARSSSPCCRVGVVEISGPASLLVMALLLEDQTWCRTNSRNSTTPQPLRRTDLRGCWVNWTNCFAHAFIPAQWGYARSDSLDRLVR